MSEHRPPPPASDDPVKNPVRKGQGSGTPTREDRLKAALKANMGRRKAQARARAAPENPVDNPAENLAGRDDTDNKNNE